MGKRMAGGPDETSEMTKRKSFEAAPDIARGHEAIVTPRTALTRRREGELLAEAVSVREVEAAVARLASSEDVAVHIESSEASA